MQQCATLENAECPDEISKEYGINRRSSLLDLHHFDVQRWTDSGCNA